MSTARAHTWKFFRAGGLDQVMIRDGRDIVNLNQLDQKLWVALSCPTRGVEFDSRTLDLIDTDKDHRIRAPELLAAIQWTAQRLRNQNDLMQDAASLPLAAINDQDAGGVKLLASAKRLLATLGKANAEVISPIDTADAAKILAQTKFNGDGIVPAESAGDADTARVIEEIVACLGGEADRSGKPGVNQAKLDTFFKEAQAYADWWAKSETEKAVLALGDGTAVAFGAFKAVRGKVDDYFARCCVAAFDARAAAAMNRAETEFVTIAARDLTITSGEIAQLPLARVEPARPLPLRDGVNPAWATALDTFRAAVVAPLLGADKTSMTQAEWGTITARLAPYEAWLGAKAGAAVEKLGVARVRAILVGKAKDTIAILIKQDASFEDEYAQISDVDKLIHCRRDLNRLVHNYVNLSDFYDPRRTAMFQMGRLYMDGRACDLCFHISDIGKHATLIGTCKIYLAYCEITRPATGEKKNICAAFTAGFAESLWVGRNGVYYDREGNDWDAVIVKVVESPISLREAFWSPWKKIASMIGEQVKKLLAARDAAALAAASKTADEAGKGVESGKPAAVPRVDGAAMASSVAAIGIAVGLLGSAVAGLVSTVSGLPLWKSLVGVVGVILIVSAPSTILAYFKLRARDLAPILNACGWAVNSRIRLTLSLGRALTQEAKLPEHAERQLTDPYADKTAKRNSVILLLVILALIFALWRFNLLDRYLPDQFKHVRPAPEAVSPPAPVAPAPAASVP